MSVAIATLGMFIPAVGQGPSGKQGLGAAYPVGIASKIQMPKVHAVAVREIDKEQNIKVKAVLLSEENLGGT